jgi:hypothetical protein
MQFAGSPKQQAEPQPEETVTSADPQTPPGAPSWASVLATTIRLWVTRRLHHLGRSRRASLIAICVLVVAAVVVILRFTGTSSSAARVSASGSAQPSHAQPSHAPQSQAPHGSARPSAGIAAVQSQAAAWTAGQLGGDETIACDPSMCAALGAHGVASSRLVSLPPSASGVPGTDVIVASPSAHAWLSQDAPTLLASFGSGAQLIEARAISAGVPVAYQALLRSDLADRRSAGAQLMQSRRIRVGAQGARAADGQCFQVKGTHDETR